MSDKRYWIAKSEPTTYSIEDLKREKETLWDGVRNYQARNFLVEMKKEDQILIYHSNADLIGIAGIAKVVSQAVEDPSQFDKKSKYYDPDSKKEQPRWFSPKVSFLKQFDQIITLDKLKTTKGLEELIILRKGNRLSVTPLTEREFNIILTLNS